MLIRDHAAFSATYTFIFFTGGVSHACLGGVHICEVLAVKDLCDYVQLRQAYVNQRNEIMNLREQLSKRDRRIEQLEEEVRSLCAATSASGQSVNSVA